jgi:hypothetical protein
LVDVDVLVPEEDDVDVPLVADWLSPLDVDCPVEDD